MPQKLRIDFVSDIACPWCVIGLLSLQQALAALTGVVAAELYFQPFELNPDMGPEGEIVAEHIQKKYGSSPEQAAASRSAIIHRGEALGFRFNYSPGSRIWNTFDAHRLLHWAGIEGWQVQLKQALFAANFTEGAATSDHNVLIASAQAAGLDPVLAGRILSSDAYGPEVRAAEQLWRARGIQAVPAVIINERWMIQGGQPPDVFEQAIRDIVSGAANEARA